MNRRLFHFVGAADIEAIRATEGAGWSPPSLATEGFVHLSFAEQLAGTLAVHFAKAERVLLVELDRSALGPELKVERSRGDEDFPHLYRALRAGEVLRAWMLVPAGGHWSVPALGERAEADEPAGRSLDAL